jgi:hypothetical protein
MQSRKRSRGEKRLALPSGSSKIFDRSGRAKAASTAPGRRIAWSHQKGYTMLRAHGVKSEAGAAYGRPRLEAIRNRSVQVDRGCRTPREEERPGAPGSASATPALQRDRQRPVRVELRRAQAVIECFRRNVAIFITRSLRFLRWPSLRRAWRDSPSLQDVFVASTICGGGTAIAMAQGCFD